VHVLVEISCFLGSCHIEGRNICGSKQDSRCAVLEYAYECQQYSEFSWIGWLLSEVYQRVLEYNKPMTELLGKDKKFK
jgi:hypothetical protein